MNSEEIAQLRSYCMLLEQGLHPPDVTRRSENRLRQEPVKRLELLTALQRSMQHLARTIHQADPDSHLEVTWKHFELGAMHWREWLLLARMHLRDHVRQLQKKKRLPFLKREWQPLCSALRRY